jgi:Glyoxalase-like domain
MILATRTLAGGTPGAAPDGATVQNRRVNIARWDLLVIDCPDPWDLAGFYQKLLGMRRLDSDDQWVIIGESEQRPAIAFQRADDYQPPQWPDPDHPQHVRLDVKVDDLDKVEAQLISLGAKSLPGRGERYRVLADPVGHPFCICR